jgi:hypothetical protein
MSGINGDKSRFHRKRKSKIARRARNRKNPNLNSQDSSAVSATKSAPKAVTA